MWFWLHWPPIFPSKSVAALAAFVDGFRYNIRSMVRVMGEELSPSYSYPHAVLERSVVPVLEKLNARINRNSALWTQFHFL